MGQIMNDEMLFTLQDKSRNTKFYLYDAVYLYLLTLNRTLAEGDVDYRNGHLIVNRTIGQRFVGKLSTRIKGLFVDPTQVIALLMIAY